MELKAYFGLIKKWLWLVVLAMVVSVTASYFSVSRMPRVYQAATTVMVGQSIEKANPSTQDFAISQALAQTYRDMVTRRPILEGAARKLGLDAPPSADNVSARLVAGTQLLEIAVRDTNPDRARAIADEIAQQLIQQTPTEAQEARGHQEFVRSQLRGLEENIRATEDEIEAERVKLSNAKSARAIEQYQGNIAALQQKLSDYQTLYASLLQTVQGANFISVVEPATLPSRPVSPRVMETLLLAAAIGLVLALGGAFCVEYLDDTIKTAEDVMRAVGLPTIATIVRTNGKGGGARLAPLHQPLSPVVEAYRVLRTNIHVCSVDKPIRTLIVTSANPLEGKTTTASNLAVVMAQAGMEVILVDADLRRSSIHRIFQLPNRAGLTNVLLQDRPSLGGWLQTTEVQPLRVLTSGPLPPNPSEMLGSKKMRQLIDELVEGADLALFDTPPVLSVTDAMVLAIEADGVLMVVDAGHTRRTAARHAVEQLKQVGANILGVVLNGVPPGQVAGHYTYYAETSEKRWRGLPFSFRRRRTQPPSV